MTTPTLSSPEFLGNLALPSLPGVYAADVQQPVRRGHQNPMDTINASEKNRRRVQYWQSRDVMSMCVCDCPGLPSNSPCYCTDTLQTWRKELDKIPSAHTITGTHHSPGLGSFNCANVLLCVNASVTCTPMGERAVCYAHSANGTPSDQVYFIMRKERK